MQVAVANKLKIDFSCPKCAGIETTVVKYAEVNDYLQCSCTRCSYEWKLDPADRPINPPIPDGDSDVK